MILYKAKILKIFSAFFVLTIISSCINCSTSIEFGRSIRRVQFKIGSVNDFKIAGVSLSGKKSAKDFSDSEQSKLSEAIASNKLPSSFTLNIIARNPNDGTEGTKKISSSLINCSWKLFVNDDNIDSGIVTNEFTIIKEAVIPLKIRFNLSRYIPDIYKLSFNIAVDEIIDEFGSAAKMMLKAAPVIETDMGPLMTEEINIVNYEFR